VAQNGHRSRLARMQAGRRWNVTYSNKAGGSGAATVDRFVDRRFR
jgi:hypothetical protein